MAKKSRLTDGPAVLSELVSRFRRNLDEYGNPGYKEAHLRQEFLNPLFGLLGWDIDNRAGSAEAYKEVIHEDSVKVGGGTKAPDYCFRIGSTRKFFVEAKKPSVNIKEDADAAFQLRRYAWSSKLPLSVLTNFEHFAVYDCRFKPERSDRASTARVLLIHYEELPGRWAELSDVFAKSSILQGLFDRFLEGRRKRGTTEVDDSFLAEIEAWRSDLARNIALRNTGIDQAQLNVAVQLIIDRIVFLRICEDRAIEPYGQLGRLTNGTGIYQNLFELFEKADDRYNSGLFHFGFEKGRLEPPDTLTPGLEIDDKVLQQILSRLYYPDSPYEFSVIPASILGQVYERFLGSVIRLTAGHQAKVEPKPEVRKAGGVYYTPDYIVRFIVSKTLGRHLSGKSLEDASQIRVLDPACGSGSFLIEAYQHLLDWYLVAYRAQPTRHRQQLTHDDKGDWRLTNAERKRILLAHIFGVDIDSQAVEVTKLSLLLKVLEGESERTISEQLRLFQQRALPDLAANIKCGDSLVGPDFLDDQQLRLIADEADISKVGVFDWQREFPAVFKRRQKGFQSVIGNPPYVYRNATHEALRAYYSRAFKSAEGNFELYKFFLERSKDLCAKDGSVGFIVSATFLVQPTFAKLRSLLVKETTVLDLAPLGPDVFKDATVDTAIIVFQPTVPKPSHQIDVRIPAKPSGLEDCSPKSVRQARFRKNDGNVFDYKLTDEGAEIVKYLFDNFEPIEKGFEFGVGINTGYIKALLVSDHKLDGRYHRMVPGDGIGRYAEIRTDGWIMYDPDFVRSKGELGRTLPAEHLLSSDKILVVRTRNLSLPARIVATIDRSGSYNLNRLSNIVAREGYSLVGLLGILNSRLFNWLYSTRFFDYEIKPVYLRASPMADVNDKALVRAVSLLMTAYDHRRQAKTEPRRRACMRRIEALERALDSRVFSLYGLSKTQIQLVERDSAPALQFSGGDVDD